jgi:hypothetical protein
MEEVARDHHHGRVVNVTQKDDEFLHGTTVHVGGG